MPNSEPTRSPTEAHSEQGLPAQLRHKRRSESTPARKKQRWIGAGTFASSLAACVCACPPWMVVPVYPPIVGSGGVTDRSRRPAKLFSGPEEPPSR